MAIPFVLGQPDHVKMVVYDRQGQEVVTLANHSFPAGTNEVTWSGRNNSQSMVASGVYLVVITIGNDVTKQKIVVVK